jgi:hypothetical protein
MVVPHPRAGPDLAQQSASTAQLGRRLVWMKERIFDYVCERAHRDPSRTLRPVRLNVWSWPESGCSCWALRS